MIPLFLPHDHSVFKLKYILLLKTLLLRLLLLHASYFIEIEAEPDSSDFELSDFEFDSARDLITPSISKLPISEEFDAKPTDSSSKTGD